MEIQKEVAKEKRGIRRYFNVPAGTEATYIDRYQNIFIHKTSTLSFLAPPP